LICFSLLQQLPFLCLKQHLQICLFRVTSAPLSLNLIWPASSSISDHVSHFFSIARCFSLLFSFLIRNFGCSLFNQVCCCGIVILRLILFLIFSFCAHGLT
jgi:hypothetical protein